jgi:acetate---CoA ligase (ADP-forming)
MLDVGSMSDRRARCPSSDATLLFDAVCGLRSAVCGLRSAVCGPAESNGRSVPSALSRLLSPRSVAVVGASERRRMSNIAVGHLLSADVDLHLVNPNSDEEYGVRTFPSLGSIGRTVDAVLCLVGAEASVGVAEEAVRLGCGGMVVVASGFAEAGESGQALQGRLQALCSEAAMPVIGPNCSGFVNRSWGVSLFTGTAVECASGGLSILSQSGYLVRATMVAARERGLGIRVAISTGNEAVTGLPDYVNFLAEDPETRVICAVVEQVRDADAFFAAVERARSADKAVIALKLGTSERGLDIMRSHTGAIATESWVYDVGFRQAGVVVAHDVEDLLDRAQLLVQMPPDRWRSARKITVISSSGGVAALASDTLTGEGVSLPLLEHLVDPIRRRIPGAIHANPLDLTGFSVEPPAVVEDLIEVFTTSGDVDAVVVCWWLSEEDEERAELLLEPLRNVARRCDLPLVMASVEASRVGSWTVNSGQGIVSFCRGLRGAARSFSGMAEHVERPPWHPRLQSPRPSLARPTAVMSEVGPMVTFADAMRLLSEVGISVAPWRVSDPFDVSSDPRFAELGDDLVVKLADVPHRTQLRAVKVGVSPADVGQVAEDLAGIAKAHEVPRLVALQARKTGGEAFIGLRTRSDLGPVLVIGLGGSLVEHTRTIVGRLLPLTRAEVEDMLDEWAALQEVRDLWAHEAWDRAAFASSILAVADLGQRSSAWLDSVDVNPLICDEHGCVAVDALLVMLEEQEDAP